MISSTTKRKKEEFLSSTTSSTSHPRPQFLLPTPLNDNHDLTTSTTITVAMDLFSFSPFGLRCTSCKHQPQLDLDERSIQIHLRKHGIESKASTVRPVYKYFSLQIQHAQDMGSINVFREDHQSYKGFACICGKVFPTWKVNALRHCQRYRCDVAKLRKVELMKLRCGRYVTDAQVNAFFRREPTAKINQQFDYSRAREILRPLLPKKEQHDHTYTHMYLPLIDGCDDFGQKIKNDFVTIHSPPDLASESLLVAIHDMAERWLVCFSQKNILMVPGNLRAGLQTFEGSEVNEVNQQQPTHLRHATRSLEFIVRGEKVVVVFISAWIVC
jgi:hypothetical protein